MGGGRGEGGEREGGDRGLQNIYRHIEKIWNC